MRLRSTKESKSNLSKSSNHAILLRLILLSGMTLILTACSTKQFSKIASYCQPTKPILSPMRCAEDTFCLSNSDASKLANYIIELEDCNQKMNLN